MRNVVIVSAGLVLTLLLIMNACAAAQAPAQTPAAAPAGGAPGLSAKPAWEADWENTLREARKEGKVVVYTMFGAEWRGALSEAMSRKYGVAVEGLTATSNEVAERVMREQRTRTYMADVVIVGTSQFQLIFRPEGLLQPLEKELILPEVGDAKAWWRGEPLWVDPDTKTYLQFHDYVLPPIVINTDLVKPDEVKSWKGLLNPKWKGKIVINDPSYGGGSGQKIMTMLAYGIMDWDFIGNLVKQEPVLLRDNRLMVEWVARGKNPMVIGARSEIVSDFANAGAPLKQTVPSEGTYVTGGSGNVSLPKGAPHPNAAKIFINFLLTKEGQTISSRIAQVQSARVDVPVDHLDPVVVRQPGVKYISSTDKGFLDAELELKKGVSELFKPLLK